MSKYYEIAEKAKTVDRLLSEIDELEAKTLQPYPAAPAIVDSANILDLYKQAVQNHENEIFEHRTALEEAIKKKESLMLELSESLIPNVPFVYPDLTVTLVTGPKGSEIRIELNQPPEGNFSEEINDS